MTVIDQALKQRRSITNALGQLTRVDEPDETGSLGEIASPTQPTNYQYDTLNNLINVQQTGTTAAQCGTTQPPCTQTRTFAYDSLSRLQTATNPESGLINYAYDNNGNLATKTDARSITTSYGYDNLNRVLTRTYSGESGYQTPAVAYFYDNVTNAKGKLIKVVTAATATNQIAETRYTSFDILGRVLSSSQVTDGQTYNSGYVYNLSGALMEQTYPSGRVVKNTLGQDGNLAQVQSAKAGGTLQNYANTFNYTAAGAVSAMRLGNGRWENTTFNSRLQPVQIGLGSSATSQNLLKLNYEYGATASVNNGNITKQTISVPTETRNNVTYAAFTATQNYTYDTLNRLKDATENITGQTNPNWQQTFIYDRFGNRTFDTANGNTTTLAAGCAVNICNPAANPANNRLIGASYDNAGNTAQDTSGQTFVYDAENKQVQVSNSSGIVGQYFYDGDGKRVKKIVPASGETTIFVYDAGGKMVAEYSTVTASAQDAKISYLTSDTLGSPRITTDANGAVISRRDFQPFGEEIARAGYGEDEVRQKFTAYERDGETGLDYAQARMFGSSFGRFTSPDPLMASARIENPQSMNRYSYTTNNPLKYSDPSGLFQWSAALGENDDDATLLANANAIQDKKANKAALKSAHSIISMRNKFRNAMTEAAKAGAKSDIPEKVANAIASYGKESENNGVVVTFGENANNDPGVTTANGTNISDISAAKDGSKVRAEVLVTFDNDADTENLILSVAHEGQHVADRQSFANAWNSLGSAFPGGINGDPSQIYNSAYAVTHRTSETRAYTVSALVAQGRGSENLNFSVGRTNYEIYSRSGGINLQRINDFLNASPTYNTVLNNKIIRPGQN